MQALPGVAIWVRRVLLCEQVLGIALFGGVVQGQPAGWPEVAVPERSLGPLAFQPQAQTNLDGRMESVSTTLTHFAYSISITNQGGSMSDPLRIELWAYSTPYTRGEFAIRSGHRLYSADVSPPRLCATCTIRASGSGPIREPPPGTYYLAIFITEFDGGTFNDGYYSRFYFVNSRRPIRGPPRQSCP